MEKAVVSLAILAALSAPNTLTVCHVSWVEAAYTNNDYVDAYGQGGRFVTQSNWVIEASYSRIDPDRASNDDVWTYAVDGDYFISPSGPSVSILTGTTVLKMTVGA